MPSTVARPLAASSEEALIHFQNLLRFEADCWDVHYAMNNDLQDFVLLDVRNDRQLFEQGHVPGAIHFPHKDISEQTLADYPSDTLFVVYCAGPHCNATEKAAIKLARLRRPVKKMIGGVCGWLDEGFALQKN